MTQPVDLHNLSSFDENGILRPEKLGMVHVTSFMPKKVGDHWEIQSTSKATDYLYVRNTIHFTVGHHVASHMWGNWDEKGIMIVAPLKGMIDNNGIPLGMGAQDTWFETTPDHDLQMPQGTHIFRPATPDEKFDGLAKTEGDVTIYKTSGFTPEDKKDFLAATSYITRGWNISLKESHDLTLKNIQKLPDDFFAKHIKEVLLEKYLYKNGYCTNSEFLFSQENSEGQTEITTLGDKLGCRFTASGNKQHSNVSFESYRPVGTLHNHMFLSDFILHLDKFNIIGKQETAHPDFPFYIFAKPGQEKMSISVPTRKRSEILETIEFLKLDNEGEWKTALDNEENQERDAYHEWSPAYRATYRVWKEKTLKRLHQYHTEAKDFDFDKFLTKLEQRITDFKSQKHSLRDTLAKVKEKSDKQMLSTVASQRE